MILGTSIEIVDGWSKQTTHSVGQMAFEIVSTFCYGHGVDKDCIQLGKRSLKVDFAFNGSLHSLVLPWLEFEAPCSLIDDLVSTIKIIPREIRYKFWLCKCTTSPSLMYIWFNKQFEVKQIK